MITIRHIETREGQLVESLSGIDMSTWEEVVVQPPAEAALAAGARYNGFAWVPPAERRALPLFDYLQLWTPAEMAWFKNTNDPIAAQAFILTLGSPVIDLDHPQVIAGIRYAEQAMPLPPGRADRILVGLPPEPAQ